MVRIFTDVKRIIIHPTNITLLTPERFRVVPRDNWAIFVDGAGVKQVQTKPDFHPERTVLFMQDKMQCRVSMEDQEILCGKKPKTLRRLNEAESFR